MSEPDVDTEQCEAQVGDRRCGLPLGHNWGESGTPHQIVNRIEVELTEEVGEMLELHITQLQEKAAELDRQVKFWQKHNRVDRVLRWVTLGCLAANIWAVGHTLGWWF